MVARRSGLRKDRFWSFAAVAPMETLQTEFSKSATMYRAKLSLETTTLETILEPTLERLLDRVFTSSNELGASYVKLSGPSDWWATIDIHRRKILIDSLSEPSLILVKALAFGIETDYIDSTEPTRRWLAPINPLEKE